MNETIKTEKQIIRNYGNHNMNKKEIKEELQNNSYEDSCPFTGREFIYIKKYTWEKLMEFLNEEDV